MFHLQRVAKIMARILFALESTDYKLLTNTQRTASEAVCDRASSITAVASRSQVDSKLRLEEVITTAQ